MSEKGSSFPAHNFTANRFKALDYTFEKTTRVKVIMNLLALPEPFFTGTSNLYPHNGKVCEDTYRTPWKRGKVFSSCKLLVSGSALEDLGDRSPVNSPERFDINLSKKSEGAEVIPSSSGDLLKDLEQDKYICLVKGSQSSFCQDSFLKWTPEQIKPDNKNKDFLLPEDLMMVDYLSQFKRHLPTLQAKLSRLRTLTVSDPLLRSTDGTEGSTFRKRESFEIPPGLEIKDIQTSGNIYEDFEKESLAMEESLLLPTVVDTVDLPQQYFTTLSSLCGLMSVFPEQLDSQPPVLDVLHEDVTASVEICQYEILEKSVKWKICMTQAKMEDNTVLPTELELDLTLSPETSLCPISLSTHELQMEELSLRSRPTLLSAKTQTEMEARLWNAEKHSTSVVGFLLAEPQICEPDVPFQCLSKVFKVLKLERQSLTIPSEDMQVFLCNSSEFTEKMRSEVSSAVHGSGEDFEKLPLQDFEVTDMIYLKKRGSAAFHAQATPDENCFQREAFANAFQKPAVNTSKRSENQIFTNPPVQTIDVVPDMSASGIDTRSKDRTIQRDHSLEQVASSRPNIHDNHRGVVVKRCLPETILDPLSSFMMLRTEQAVPVEAAQNTLASQLNRQTPELPPSPDQMHKSGKRLTYAIGAVSENVTREQESACQSAEEVSSQHVHQSVSQYRRDVQATDSQKRAYWELLAFAEPFLKSARQLGLNLPVRGDFSCLDPDQTHFLLKQQEKVLCRAHAQGKVPVGDQDILFNLAALVHALVMFKELLLNCSLSVAVEYLTHTTETCAQQKVQQLLKRLQIILFLSNKNPETNFRLLELQHQLSTWLHSRNGQATEDKVLVLISVDCDNSRSILMTSLSHVTGGAVTAVSPEEGMKKLNGASLVSHMQGAVCVVACEEHVGPDFPWNCFSLVVEYDHPGPSPWATICKEKGISHFTFNTVTPDAEEENVRWCLEDNVPYVLFVTEGLLSCPQLLQTLESGFNITVVERRHCSTLQMLGGIHRYSVLTVDESTCIVIQEEDELCQERASEVIVMRLSALSLQYSCCWLILHCPDSQRGGLSSPAFSSLALCYSSLQLFKNQKLEDLTVKVLIACEVTDIAKWISRICFLSLMSTDGDPLDFLDRDWLSVIPSEAENRLLLFPYINPLVGQLMLKRAPGFQWLLGASLPQLQELLPEVPQKVLKLFSDTTSMFTSPSNPTQSHMYSPEENIPSNPRHCFWTNGPGPVLTDFQTEPEAVIIPHPELFCTDQSSRLLFGGDKADFGLHPSSFLGGSGEPLQRNWTSSDPWREEHRHRSGDSMKLSGWGGRAGVLGGVVQRVQAKSHSPFRLDFSCSPVAQQSVNHHMSVCPTVHFSESQHTGSSLSPPPDFMLWNPSRNLSSSTASANYGTKCCLGQERKRSADAAALTSLKKGRLCYERVPGRSDGQTRLKLF